MGTTAQQAVDDVVARGLASLPLLCETIEAAGLQEASLGEAYLGRRGADVLAHLHGWHELFSGWCDAYLHGREVHFPAEGYTWDSLRELNDAIYERYRDMPYARLKEMALTSRRDMFHELMRVPASIAATPGGVPWSAESLVEVADECGAKHDNWGLERIQSAIDAGRP
jgi:hypothetical protein